MQQIFQAVLSCALFIAAGVIGFIVRGCLSERHRDRDTVDFLRLALGSLVTFLAIVLGLLTASSKSHFDAVAADYRRFAAELVQFDGALREIGDGAVALRTDMRAYVAAVIASTWPDESAPAGAYLHGLVAGQREAVPLSELLANVGARLRSLEPEAGSQGQAARQAFARFTSLMNTRWTVIESGQSTIPGPFYDLMLLWTALMFVGFGLCAPRNAVAAVTVLICAISLASVIYVILELDDPLGGSIAISSQPLRNALADIDLP